MRSVPLILVLLALPMPVAAEPDSTTIVVTGRRLSDLEADLARCRSRDCPADEDMRLSLALAEAQFVAGSYRDARAALEASLRRHPGAAKQHPDLVASLHRASARVSQHYGDRNAVMDSSFAIGRAMKQAYPEDSPQVFFARLEAADMMVRSQIDGDRIGRTYDNLATQAKRLGDPRYGYLVELRRAWFDSLRGQEWRADARLDRVVADADPNMKLAAEIIRLRIAHKRGDEARADELMKSVIARSSSQARPQLITDVPISLSQSPTRIKWGGMDKDALVVRPEELASIASPENSWIDVGFWVAPDGSVQDVEVLRPASRRWWHSRVLEAVSRRQYTPYAAVNGQPTAYRVERFTLTSSIERGHGSLVNRRDQQLRIRSLDLTPSSPPADPGRKAG